MACDTAGVGVYSPPFAIMVSTPLAASTSSALSNAGSRQRVRVDADEQRPIDALLAPIVADRLGDRQHVRLVEAAVERRAAMAGRAERDALRWQRTDRAVRL